MFQARAQRIRKEKSITKFADSGHEMAAHTRALEAQINTNKPSATTGQASSFGTSPGHAKAGPAAISNSHDSSCSLLALRY